MKRDRTLMRKRKSMLPNERRRQTWRNHRLRLIDRRSKWFYQQCADEKKQDVDE